MLYILCKGKWQNPIGSFLFSLDFLTIMIAYLFIAYGGVAAGAFAFGQGFLMDLYSGGMYGLFSFLHLIIFGGISLASLVIDINDIKGFVFVVFLSVFLKNVVYVMMVSVFSQNMVPKSFLVTAGTTIIGTSLISFIVFCLFNHVRASFYRNDGNELKRQL